MHFVPLEAEALPLPANKSSDRGPPGALRPSSPGAVRVIARSDNQPAKCKLTVSQMCAGIMIAQKGTPKHSAKTTASTYGQSYRLMYMFKHLLDHSSVSGEQLVQCAACTAVYKQQACLTVKSSTC